MRWNLKSSSFSIVLALLGGLGLVFLLAFQASSNYRVAFDLARSDNAHNAIKLANEFSGMIREVDLSLGDLAEYPNIAADDADRVVQRFQTLQRRLPQIDNLARINASGVLTAQLQNAPDASLEQDYFALLEQAAQSAIIHGSSASHKANLLIAHRLPSSGELDGLLVARLDQRLLTQKLNAAARNSGQHIFVIDKNLRILAQYPSGGTLPNLSTPIQHKIKNNTQQELISDETAELLLSFQPITNSPFFVVTSNSTEFYLAEWKTSIVYYLLAGFLMLILTTLMAYYFWRSQRLTRNLRAKELKLSASEARFRQMIETTPVGLVLARMPDFYITYINQHAAKMFGMPQAAALSKRAHELYYDRVDFIHHSNDALAGQSVNNAECILKHRDGNPFWANVSMSATKAAEGTTLVIGLNDITQRKKLEDELKRRATTDSLSGLANRAYFMELAKQEIVRAKRYQHPACVLMLDIDFFKKVNDRYGHQTGDRVIKTMADLCRSSLRDNDLLARIGGEEFTAFLPETPLAEAFEVAERLRKNIEQHRLELDDGGFIQFTTSIGLSALHRDDPNVEAPLKRADEALYVSKHNGRNQTSCYEQLKM